MARVPYAALRRLLRADRQIVLLNRRPLDLSAQTRVARRLLILVDDGLGLVRRALDEIVFVLIGCLVVRIAAVEKVLAQLIVLLDMSALIVVELSHLAGRVLLRVLEIHVERGVRAEGAQLASGRPDGVGVLRCGSIVLAKNVALACLTMY